MVKTRRNEGAAALRARRQEVDAGMKGDESLYADAMMAVRRGQYDDAAKLFREFLRNNARHVGALNVLRSAMCSFQITPKRKSIFARR
jgi:predicted Zn-dependent protease